MNSEVGELLVYSVVRDEAMIHLDLGMVSLPPKESHSIEELQQSELTVHDAPSVAHEVSMEDIGIPFLPSEQLETQEDIDSSVVVMIFEEEDPKVAVVIFIILGVMELIADVCEKRQMEAVLFPTVLQTASVLQQSPFIMQGMLVSAHFEKVEA